MMDDRIIGAIKYLFSLIGFGMLVAAYFLFANTNSLVAEAVKAEGIVQGFEQSRSDDSITYRPIIHFMTGTGEEIEFVSSSGSSSPSYHRGEKVEILYLPSEPQTAEINSFFPLWGGFTIVLGLGGVFFLVGVGGIFFHIRRKRIFGDFKNRHEMLIEDDLYNITRDIPFSLGGLFLGIKKKRSFEYLKNHGVPIDTEFQSVERNTSYSFNGKHPFIVLTQWQDRYTSEVHIFRSNNLWFDPSDVIQLDLAASIQS